MKEHFLASKSSGFKLPFIKMFLHSWATSTTQEKKKIILTGNEESNSVCLPVGWPRHMLIYEGSMMMIASWLHLDHVNLFHLASHGHEPRCNSLICRSCIIEARPLFEDERLLFDSMCMGCPMQLFHNVNLTSCLRYALHWPFNTQITFLFGQKFQQILPLYDLIILVLVLWSP